MRWYTKYINIFCSNITSGDSSSSIYIQSNNTISYDLYIMTIGHTIR